jgi:hypothetical protein
MTDDFKPTAASLATFDQIKATLSEALDGLLDTHYAAITTDPQMAPNPELALAGLATFLAREVDHVGLAELLAIAVDRLVRNHPREE